MYGTFPAQKPVTDDGGMGIIIPTHHFTRRFSVFRRKYYNIHDARLKIKSDG